MCAPNPPPVPDYKGAAQAQGDANLQAARQQAQINNPNVVTPYGSQTVTWQDDQPTLIQTLSPEQQALYNQRVQTQQQLGTVAQQGASSLQGVVGTGVDFSGAPAMPGSAADTRTKVIDAMMARVNEDVDRQQDTTHSNLIAAGIRPGTKAYADQMALGERARTDARNQAMLAAGQEASRDYAMDSDRRKQVITELLAQRQVPINEITALLSGSQVSNPFTTPGYAQNTQVQPAPLYGAAVNKADYLTNLYNVRAAQAGNIQSGLFGLGGAGLMGAGLYYGG